MATCEATFEDVLRARFTPQWIQEYVCHDEQLDPLAPVEWQELGKGKGALGSLYRVQCQGCSFVLKVPPPPSNKWDQLLGILGVFPREIAAYSFLNQCSELDGIVPRCFFSRDDGEGRGELVLEEVRYAGHGNMFAGLRRDELFAALASLAQVHAMYASVRQGGGDQSQGSVAPEPPSPALLTSSSTMLPVLLAGALEETRDVAELAWADDNEHKALLDILEPSRWNMRACLKRTDDPATTTLVGLYHGDAWCNNILFKRDLETDAPTEAVLLDWQFCSWGNPLSDVAWLMASSLQPQHLRSWHDDALLHYHKQLLAHSGSRLATYTLELCRADYHAAFEFSVIGVVVSWAAFAQDAKDDQERSALAARMANLLGGDLTLSSEDDSV
eukprot:m.446115 g.446115  ORF g.446115 m.446115 type:complete len:387 (-) comp20307_c4_seq3:80-1240(-)